jgi:hypothetical protein
MGDKLVGQLQYGRQICCPARTELELAGRQTCHPTHAKLVLKDWAINVGLLTAIFYLRIGLMPIANSNCGVSKNIHLRFTCLIA